MLREALRTPHWALPSDPLGGSLWPVPAACTPTPLGPQLPRRGPGCHPGYLPPFPHLSYHRILQILPNIFLPSLLARTTPSDHHHLFLKTYTTYKGACLSPAFPSKDAAEGQPHSVTTFPQLSTTSDVSGFSEGQGTGPMHVCAFLSNSACSCPK